jgi:hypothetical protein
MVSNLDASSSKSRRAFTAARTEDLRLVLA